MSLQRYLLKYFLVNRALQVYIRHLKQKVLRKAMRKEALADAELDLQTAREWSAVDQETWQQIK